MLTIGKVRLTIALTAVLSALTFIPVANAQDLSQIKKPGDKGDYPVHVGKRVRWASEVYRERIEAQHKAAEAARKLPTSEIVPVQRGRQIVGVPKKDAAQIARSADGTSVATSSELPAKRKAKGYFVQRGRATVWVPIEQ